VVAPKIHTHIGARINESQGNVSFTDMPNKRAGDGHPLILHDLNHPKCLKIAPTFFGEVLF
jgi:hypothetical protein